MNISKQGKQVAILYVSTFLGTLLGVLASIINTRFLEPTHYGDVRYVQNIINLIASLLLFGYFHSGSRLLAISRSTEYSGQIRGLMVIILLVATGVLTIGTFANYAIHGFFGESAVAYLFLVSLPVCSHPLLLNYINTTAQGDNHIGRMSAARILPSLLYIPIAYWIYSRCGATSARMILLQWGVASLLLAGIIVSTRPRFEGLKSIWKELHEENKTYGLQVYYGQLAMVATNYVAGITLGIFNADNANVCYFTLAVTITSPLILVPSIIGQTYFKEFAGQSYIPQALMRNTVLITCVSCTAYILLIKPLVSLLYPETYSVLGDYAAMLAVGCSIHGFGDMINRYLGAHAQGAAIRNASFWCGILKMGGYVGLVYLWNIQGALLTNILSSITYTFVLYSYYRNYIKRRDLIL